MINGDGDLHIYMLSVGQGDTSVVISPNGSVIIIDAMRPRKLIRLLNDLGFDNNIEHLVITHPHDDHFSGANRLALDTNIVQATVAPFWHEFGMGPPTYRRLLGHLQDQDTKVRFLSGYSRSYPDGSMRDAPGGGAPEVNPQAPYLEMLGPTNGMVRMLEDANVFNTNHLSIITRIAWNRFGMIITGDAQMENWSFFDSERMMEGPCQVLRASHHGSPNGTQWERINRLSPSQVIISSDPTAGHHLPDLTTAALFTKFDSVARQMAVITRDSGSIHLRVTGRNRRTFRRFGDLPNDNIDLNNSATLTERNNPSDWRALLNARIAGL